MHDTLIGSDLVKMRGFIAGVKDVGYLIEDVEPELQGCKGMGTDIDRI